MNHSYRQCMCKKSKQAFGQARQKRSYCVVIRKSFCKLEHMCLMIEAVKYKDGDAVVMCCKILCISSVHSTFLFHLHSSLSCNYAGQLRKFLSLEEMIVIRATFGMVLYF